MNTLTNGGELQQINTNPNANEHENPRSGSSNDLSSIHNLSPPRLTNGSLTFVNRLRLGEPSEEVPEENLELKEEEEC